MATIYLRGRVWWINDKGKRKSLNTTSKAEAEAQVIGLDRRSAAGPSFEQWAIEYAEWHSREYPDSYFRVEQILRCHLIPAFGPIPIATISKLDVERYKQRREASVGTITKELRTLQACINKAVEWELISHSKIKGVKPPRDVTSKPPRWYTKEELQRIYDAASGLHGSIWRLYANTGMRRGEGQQLKWSDVGADSIRLLSDESGRTKSAKWRLVPISPGAKVALDRLRFRSGDHVLPPMNGPSLTREFSRDLQKAGLDGSLHCLRHTYCSHLVMNGIPLRTVQVLAGHSTIKVTERYAHLAPDHLQDAMKGLTL